MTPAARIAAAIEVLDQWRAGFAPEQALSRWSRAARYAGSGDRAAVRDIVYDCLRNARSFSVLGGGETGRALALGYLRSVGTNPETHFTGEGFAPAPLDPIEKCAPNEPVGLAALDCPDWLWPLFDSSLGEDAAREALQQLKSRASITLRMNVALQNPETIVKSLQVDGIETKRSEIAETALIVVSNPRRIKNSAAYRSGLVDIQDAASQAAVGMLPLVRGARVLDLCAGGGGKSLALADRGANVFAYDKDQSRMSDLPKRAARAGQTVTCLTTPPKQETFDLVLCDVPCSGSGTWRRTPAMKWTLDKTWMNALHDTQQEILRNAAHYVSDGGILAYATCSVFDVENDLQIETFLKNNPDWTQISQTHWPIAAENDGFFLSILQPNKG